MLRTVLIGLAILVVAVVAIVALLASRKPDSFRVARQVAIAARPGDILPLLTYFRRWTAWSPWERLDPDLKRSYSGPPSGVGAGYAWEGRKAGAGRMEITGAEPERVDIDLAFEKPFRSRNRVAFTLAPQGGTTLATWEMTGPMPFMAKVMHVFMNMDRLVGGDFERGLAALKAEAERTRALEGPPGP